MQALGHLAIHLQKTDTQQHQAQQHPEGQQGESPFDGHVRPRLAGFEQMVLFRLYLVQTRADLIHQGLPFRHAVQLSRRIHSASPSPVNRLPQNLKSLKDQLLQRCESRLLARVVLHQFTQLLHTAPHLGHGCCHEREKSRVTCEDIISRATLRLFKMAPQPTNFHDDFLRVSHPGGGFDDLMGAPMGIGGHGHKHRQSAAKTRGDPGADQPTHSRFPPCELEHCRAKQHDERGRGNLHGC